MRFKIKNTQINVSFLIFVPVLLLISAGKTEIIVNIVICTFLHEAVHLIFIAVFKGSVKEIDIGISGGNIIRGDCLANYKEFIIHISAPVFNILSGLLVLYINNINPAFSFVSIFTGAFNILPFYNFDGGNALYYFLKTYYSDNTTKKIIYALSIVVVMILVIFATILLLLNKCNVFIIFISLYLLLTLIFNKIN